MHLISDSFSTEESNNPSESNPQNLQHQDGVEVKSELGPAKAEQQQAPEQPSDFYVNMPGAEEVLEWPSEVGVELSRVSNDNNAQQPEQARIGATPLVFEVASTEAISTSLQGSDTRVPLEYTAE